LLPCFPLERHHLGSLAGWSSSHRALVGGGIGSGTEEAEATDGGHRRRSCSYSSDAAVATPSDFHSYLCDRIRRACDRVILASLYVGVGSGTYDNEDDGGGGDGTTGCREDELLRALRDAAARSAAGGGGGGRGGGSGPRKVQVLLDANRALRGVSVTRNGEGGGQSHGRGGASSAVGVGGGGVVVTNSAEAVHSRLRPLLADDDRGRSGVFLFPVNDERLRRILPSPLDEVAGVFHMKAYIVDDEMVLSGANLSEEYFDDRLDRYMLFANGGGGVVDFYAELCDALCGYAIRYDGRRPGARRRLRYRRGTRRPESGSWSCR
jgi:CDP-diacylglycerol--glycerol-3-phosphate 3-phosphatidyltransferase